MDADFKEKRRSRFSSSSEARWSMNSQRLEEIVAELMRPIGDLRHSFDTDLSSLLEEYLTEAGLRALDEEDDTEGGEGAAAQAGAGELVLPNFAELALLVQQSASIYGRKVDFLYQHVLSVSDSLHNSTIEMANPTNDEDEPSTPSGSRRKRRASGPSDFSHIELEACGAARREAGAARPPPTLPRMYLELEPRVLGDGEQPLRDYAGEPVGLLQDFHVGWRLQRGCLVEELAGCAERAALRPIPLMELQAAIEANAPPSPPPLPREESPPPDEGEGAGELQPPAAAPEPAADVSPPPALQKERKRKSEAKLEDLNGRSFKLLISPEVVAALRGAAAEFSCSRAWVARVVRARAATLRALRAACPPAPAPFRGFDYHPHDVHGFPGFPGWSSEMCAESARLASAARQSLRQSTGAGRAHDDSDDDGFFEQSSFGDSDGCGSRVEDSPLFIKLGAVSATGGKQKSEKEAAEEAEWAAWRARLAARALHDEVRAPLDVCALARAVLAQLPAPDPAPDAAPAPPRPFAAVLAAAAKDHADVSRLFLATLFLANAGNVEVVRGAPLALDSFALRLLSGDPRLYSAAAAADPVAAPAAAAPSAPATPARTPR